MDIQRPIRLALPGSLADTPDGPVILGGCCAACGALSYPRPKICASCLSEDVAEQPLATHGTLYTWTLVHQSRPGWPAPYALAYVDLDDGVRVLGPFDGTPIIGARVRVTSGTLREEDGKALLSHRFAPAESAA
jgi:uncharacterized OB-fold protein